MKKTKRFQGYYGVSAAQAKESFGKIKVNLEFLSVDNDYKCIMVSSSVAGEGKSTIVANLAVSIAASDRKTLLVDGDLRHPTQHRLFDLVNRVGLTDIISSHLDWRVYANDTSTPGLRVITAGRVPPNPAELLGSNRMGELIEDFKKEYDIILFDSSPILLVSDPVSLTKHVDGIIVVARYNFTTIQAAVNTKIALQLANKPIIGTILNNVSQSASRYEYGYGKMYGRTHSYYQAAEQHAAEGELHGQ